MCLIIHNPEGLDIDPEIIEIALWHNADGFGIFYHDTGEIKRTMSFEKPFALCSTGRPFTAHFRYSTSGKIGSKQCHPFKIDARYSLMQNGTVERLQSKTEVDTARLAKILGGIPQEHWLAVLETHPCRFAVCDSDTGNVLLANRDLWVEHEGCLYSKPDVLEDYEESRNPKPKSVSYERYFPAKEDKNWPRDVWDEQPPSNTWDEEWEAGLRGNSSIVDFDEDEDEEPARGKHVVAVYGTLKQGHGNHDRFLGSAHYLGSGVTEDRYPLVVNGLPYLLDAKGRGLKVEVELYSVSDGLLGRLDGLEGHPGWYRRELIPIVLDGTGETCNAWVYLMPDMSMDTGIYQQSY